MVKKIRNYKSERKPLSYNHLEYVVVCMAVISLVISCMLISPKRFFWNDELYSYYLLSEPSFSKMLSAFHDKINNTPFLYFFLGWCWDKIFGSTELSLRLFSSLGICTALITVWITLRRTYGFWPTTIGILGVFCTSDLILRQNAEARMYGLYLAVCAMSLYSYDRLCRSFKPSDKLLFFNFCMHAALVHTHLHGAFYSGAVLLSIILTDRHFERFRMKVYLTIIFSWLTTIFYIPSFLNQASAGSPRTWLPTPRILDLINFTTSTSSLLYVFTPIILCLIVLIGSFQFTSKALVDNYTSAGTKKNYDSTSEIHLLIFALAFIIVPIIIWMISRFFKPIFWPKYMIPTTLGWSVLISFVSSRLMYVPDVKSIFENVRKKQLNVSQVLLTSLNILLLFLLLGFLLYQPIQTGKYYYVEKPPGSSDTIFGYKELPIVAQTSAAFLERLHYTTTPQRYFYILDWAAAVNENSGMFGPQEYKHLTALKRNYPRMLKNVWQTQDFLKTYNHFLVLDYAKYICKCSLHPLGIRTAEVWDNELLCPQWVEMRLLNKGAYNVVNLGTVDNGRFCILLVSKN